jgi:hypothetical protein
VVEDLLDVVKGEAAEDGETVERIMRLMIENIIDFDSGNELTLRRAIGSQ